MPRTQIVALINPNRMKPAVAPIGVDYLADALECRGYTPLFVDLCFADDWQSVLNDFFSNHSPLAVGISVRNIDDAYFATQHFVLADTAKIIQKIREMTNVPIVLGGVGFSTAPKEILRFTKADYGIVGDGEHAFAELLDALSAGNHAPKVSGVLFNGRRESVHSAYPLLSNPLQDHIPSRRHVDNRRYFEYGGQGNIETKRGCPNGCVYCVDPVSKGRFVRLRHPDVVVAEIRKLYEMGIDVLHWCDSECNLPVEHFEHICQQLADRGLGSCIQWYAYATPEAFTPEVALKAARAGCRGINFGVDHTDDTILKRLGRRHTRETIRDAIVACQSAGIITMCDMLFGGPGETRETIGRAIDDIRRIQPDRVGLSCGVRIYPNTPLAAWVQQQGSLATNTHLHGNVKENSDLLRPIFYIDAAVGADIHEYVASLVKGDHRFFYSNPSLVETNFNYDNNELLTNAIAAGARGAYWDILRRIQEKEFYVPASASPPEP